MLLHLLESLQLTCALRPRSTVRRGGVLAATLMHSQMKCSQPMCERGRRQARARSGCGTLAPTLPLDPDLKTTLTPWRSPTRSSARPRRAPAREEWVARLRESAAASAAAKAAEAGSEGSGGGAGGQPGDAAAFGAGDACGG